MMVFRRGLTRPYQHIHEPESHLLRIEVPGLRIHTDSLDEVDAVLQNKIVQFTLIHYDKTHNSAICALYMKVSLIPGEFPLVNPNYFVFQMHAFFNTVSGFSVL